MEEDGMDTISNSSTTTSNLPSTLQQLLNNFRTSLAILSQTVQSTLLPHLLLPPSNATSPNPSTIITNFLLLLLLPNLLERQHPSLDIALRPQAQGV